MDFNKVLDLPVIHQNKGKRIGNIEDVLIDRKTKKVAFLLMGSNKWFGSKKLLGIKDVVKVSKYAVIVTDDSHLLNLGMEQEALPFISYRENLQNKPVAAATGQKIGRVDDGKFDMETGHIVEFVLTDGILQDLMSGRKRIVEIDRIIGGSGAENKRKE